MSIIIKFRQIADKIAGRLKKIFMIIMISKEVKMDAVASPIKRVMKKLIIIAPRLAKKWQDRYETGLRRL
jgi:hypothetical protein